MTVFDWNAEDEGRLLAYQAFLAGNREKVGPFGDALQGEIQIVDDAERSRASVLAMRTRLGDARAKGRSSFTDEQILTCTRIGIVYEDQYAFVVRYPVLFPNKKGPPVPGLYITWYWCALFGTQSAACGMPVMPDGKIALTKTFRHATRRWVLEFPRGGAEPGKSLLDTLKQEFKEEGGFGVGDVVSLGTLSPDDGIIGSLCPVFLVRVVECGDNAPEYAEAISGLVFFDPATFAALLVSQTYEEPQLDGSSRTYHVQGSFENYAFNQARLRGLI
jgi:ADP-ribose pyrophosphatase